MKKNKNIFIVLVFLMSTAVTAADGKKGSALAVVHWKVLAQSKILKCYLRAESASVKNPENSSPQPTTQPVLILSFNNPKKVHQKMND